MEQTLSQRNVFFGTPINWRKNWLVAEQRKTRKSCICIYEIDSIYLPSNFELRGFWTGRGYKSIWDSWAFCVRPLEVEVFRCISIRGFVRPSVRPSVTLVLKSVKMGRNYWKRLYGCIVVRPDLIFFSFNPGVLGMRGCWTRSSTTGSTLPASTLAKKFPSSSRPSLVGSWKAAV